MRALTTPGGPSSSSSSSSMDIDISASFSSYSMPRSRLVSLWSLGTEGTSSRISFSWLRMTMSGGEESSVDDSAVGAVTTKTELDSVTERTAYVLSSVHSTASSFDWPLMVRVRLRALSIFGLARSRGLGETHLWLDALSISWHSSGGNSSSLNDPFSCVYESENARLNSVMSIDG